MSIRDMCAELLATTWAADLQISGPSRPNLAMMEGVLLSFIATAVAAERERLVKVVEAAEPLIGTDAVALLVSAFREPASCRPPA